MNRFMLIDMTTAARYALIGGVLVVLAVAACALNANYKNQGNRTSAEQLTAEEVVDLEVQAAAQFEAEGGKH